VGASVPSGGATDGHGDACIVDSRRMGAQVGVTVGVQWTPPSWVALAGGAEPRPGTLRAALRRTVAPPRVRASVIHGPRNSVLVEVINGVVNSGLVEVIRNLI
jgi:hypothetical protein